MVYRSQCWRPGTKGNTSVPEQSIQANPPLLSQLPTNSSLFFSVKARECVNRLTLLFLYQSLLPLRNSIQLSVIICPMKTPNHRQQTGGDANLISPLSL